jgi:hypothetical protein
VHQPIRPSPARRRPRVAFALVLAALVAGYPGAATAAAPGPSPAQVEAARKLFAAAEKDEAAGRWAEASTKLEMVVSVKETAGVLFHLATCRERLGNLVAALDAFERARTLAKQGRVADVLKMTGPKIDELRGRIPTLRVQVPAGAQVRALRVDGRQLDVALVGSPMPLDPGEHAVEVQLEGSAPLEQRVSLAEGESRTVEAEVRAKPGGAGEESRAAGLARAAPSASARATTEPAAPPEPRSGGVPPAAGVALGAGAALAVGGVLAYRRAGDLADQSAEACARSVACDPERGASVRRWDAAALGLWLGGAAGVGLGVALVLTSKQSGAAAVGVHLSPQHVSLGARF